LTFQEKRKVQERKDLAFCLFPSGVFVESQKFFFLFWIQQRFKADFEK
jgi:hypothetical protein